jgi:hypothetical protein
MSGRAKSLPRTTAAASRTGPASARNSWQRRRRRGTRATRSRADADVVLVLVLVLSVCERGIIWSESAVARSNGMSTSTDSHRRSPYLTCQPASVQGTGPGAARRRYPDCEDSSSSEGSRSRTSWGKNLEMTLCLRTLQRTYRVSKARWRTDHAEEGAADTAVLSVVDDDVSELADAGDDQGEEISDDHLEVRIQQLTVFLVFL